MKPCNLLINKTSHYREPNSMAERNAFINSNLYSCRSVRATNLNQIKTKPKKTTLKSKNEKRSQIAIGDRIVYRNNKKERYRNKERSERRIDYTGGDNNEGTTEHIGEGALV